MPADLLVAPAHVFVELAPVIQRAMQHQGTKRALVASSLLASSSAASHHHLTTILVAAALFGCAAPAPTQTAYNRGVEAYRAKDCAAARVHWTNAAAAGDSSAENNLGYLLYYGLGGDVDASRAVSLWQKAAYAGHPEAQWHLRHAFQDGAAVPQSSAQAYAWYRCAVASAQSATVDEEIAADARRSLESLLGKLSKDEFAQGEVLAKQYIDNVCRSPQRSLTLPSSGGFASRFAPGKLRRSARLYQGPLGVSGHWPATGSCPGGASSRLYKP